DVFGEGGEERRPTVQVGDPFTEKLLLEACLEAFKTDYIVAIQDMGAAGLTSSSVEMASRGGVGIELDVGLVPRREEGMTPYEVMLSESQERMLMVARKGCEEEIRKIFHKWDLKAVVVGKVIEEECIRVKEGDRIVAELPIKPLTEDAPVYQRPLSRPSWQDEVQTLDIKEIPEPKDYNDILLSLLSSPNISSKQWIYRQYDHMVRTNTVVLPGSNAAVIRVKGTKKALAMTVDCNSRYCYLDPFVGSSIAVTEAARNLVCAGARPIAITDCLNFGNPERPEIMWQFEQSILGIRDACLRLGIPVVSGNVSFYNETSGSSIYPTPTIGTVGLIDDIHRITTQWFKLEGDVVVLLGETREELGGSEYLKVVYCLDRGNPPHIDLDVEARVQQACLEANESGIIKSAHDCSEGGLAVALAECCISPPNGCIGVDITLPQYGDEKIRNQKSKIRNIRWDALLFGESQSRIIVSVTVEDVARFMSISDKHGAPAVVIGRVGGDRLKINGLIDISVKLFPVF
ncbi:MAG: phosphoribosylformylglycinamidine synthase subunit PurL, partial [Deltaproteobacteria bacterium]|nr:phosphoribosylformylglycinamidine synthase subunit PurL [Deltaproteobacteria bacterium]